MSAGSNNVHFAFPADKAKFIQKNDRFPAGTPKADRPLTAMTVRSGGLTRMTAMGRALTGR